MQYKTLPNGLKVLFAPLYSDEVTVAVAIKNGNRYEKTANAGIGHICEHLIAGSGTEHFPNETELNRAFDSIGGEFNGETSNDVILFYITLNRRKFNLGMTLLADMILRPILTDAKIQIIKNVVSAEFKALLDDPDAILDNMRDKLMFFTNPLSHEIETMLVNSVNLKPWQIRRHYKKIVRPNRMIMAVAGGFNQEQVLEAIKREFGALNRGHPCSYELFQTNQNEARIKFQPRRMSQIRFSLGFPLWGYDDPRRYAMIFLKNLLADRPSSILMRILRSERGLVYSVEAYLWQWADAGSFWINSVTNRRGNFFQIIELILAELNCLKSKLINNNEFQLTRENLRWRAKSKFATQEFTAKFFAKQIATCGRAIPLREYLHHLNNVRRTDIRRVANDAFQFNRINLAAIGRILEKDQSRVKKMIEGKGG